jgi:hypothetical protein
MARTPSARSTLLPDQDRRCFGLAAAGGAAASISARVLARIRAEGASWALPKKVADVSLPDTSVAMAAADLARAVSPPFLFNHCLRTFVFGSLLAERDHVAYDREMIFIAAALDDLGLTTRYATPDHSSEMDGADAAKAFLVSRRVTEARVELVWNAIALHTSAERVQTCLVPKSSHYRSIDCRPL